MWVQVVEPAERFGPGALVGVLAAPLREVRLVSIAVDLGGIGGIADHHGTAVGRIDQHALMAGGVPGGRDYANALGHLGVPVDQLEAGAREIEPFSGERFLAARSLQLPPLDVERRVFEHRVLSAICLLYTSDAAEE